MICHFTVEKDNIWFNDSKYLNQYDSVVNLVNFFTA